MSGNIWEWCEDAYTPDIDRIPTDGTPYMGPSDERVLRGGCFHNWAEHCTVAKRYQMESHDLSTPTTATWLTIPCTTSAVTLTCDARLSHFSAYRCGKGPA